MRACGWRPSRHRFPRDESDLPAGLPAAETSAVYDVANRLTTWVGTPVVSGAFAYVLTWRADLQGDSRGPREASCPRGARQARCQAATDR